MTDTPPERPRRISLTDTVKAVAWSFLGVRRRGAHEHDMSTLHPVAVVAVALALALAFIAALLLIVNWVV